MEKKNVKSVSIRFPNELLDDLKYISEYEGRSINSQVLYLVRKNIEEFKTEHGDF